MILQNKLIFAVIFVAALGLYFWRGQPRMAEQPFDERAAEIAAADPNTLIPDELLTRLQSLASSRPNDPEPHYFIGNLLRSNGRSEDAIHAYQSALRRDDRHVASLIALGDLRMNEQSGVVSENAARLYERAWRLDDQQVRAGFLVGLAAYQDGREDEASAIWNTVENAIVNDDAAREGLHAMIQQATQSPVPAPDRP